MTEFTLADFHKVLRDLQPVRAHNMRITTGLLGMACLDFALAVMRQSPSVKMTKDHTHLLWADFRRSIAVDENGTTWMWGYIRGQVWWIHLGQYASKKRPAIATRFNDWEKTLPI